MAIIIIIGIFSGLILLIYGVFFVKTKENETASTPEAIDAMKQSADEIDNAISNINSVSSMIIEEMDVKYKELLFLYQMMEEKKKEIIESRLLSSSISNTHYENPVFFQDTYDSNTEPPLNVANSDTRMTAEPVDGTVIDFYDTKPVGNLRNREAILDLYSRNYNVTDIARKLGMGKGEVQLIIGLSKAGAGYE